MPDYSQFVTEDGRLVILRELSNQPGYRLNESVLTKVLDVFGHRRSREWVRTQLRKMQELGAVTIKDDHGIMVATITRAGMDHVERRSVIEGILEPSPED